MTTPDTRATDRAIAERLGYTVTVINIPESNFMHYTIGPTDLSMKRGSERPHSVPHYTTDLNEAWRLQQEHPIPGTICLNLEWLQLPPEQAAREMALGWLKWATAEQDTTAAREDT